MTKNMTVRNILRNQHKEVIYRIIFPRHSKFFPLPHYIGYSSKITDRIKEHRKNIEGAYWYFIGIKTDISRDLIAGIEAIHKNKKIQNFYAMYPLMAMHMIVEEIEPWEISFEKLDQREYEKGMSGNEVRKNSRNKDGSTFTERKKMNRHNREVERCGFNNINAILNENNNSLAMGVIDEENHRKREAYQEIWLEEVIKSGKYSAWIDKLYGDGKLWEEFNDKFFKKLKKIRKENGIEKIERPITFGEIINEK